MLYLIGKDRWHRLREQTAMAGRRIVHLWNDQPANPWLPVAFYAPLLVAGVLWGLLDGSVAVLASVGLLLAGLLLWTFLEYFIHSIAFHPSVSFVRLPAVQTSHASHHDEPSDPRRMVAQLSFTLPVTAVLFGGFWLALGNARLAAPVVAGALLGYLAYEVVHYRVHMGPRPWWLPRRLVKHHLYHHYKDPSRCFGVTTPLWDWVFRTSRPPRRWRYGSQPHRKQNGSGLSQP